MISKLNKTRIYLIALILRMIPVLLSFNLGIGLDDMFQYDMLARSIEAGNGYRWYAEDDLSLVKQYIQFDFSSVEYDPKGIPTSFRPPLYPVFLAIIYFIFGTGAKRFFITRVFQAFLSAALTPLIFQISLKIFPKNIKIAVWSSIGVAIYPMLVIYPLAIATENLFFVLFYLSLLLILLLEKYRNWQYFMIAGFIMGLTALTRSVFLGITLLTFIWMFFVLKEKKKSIIFLFTFSIIVVPWMVRNTMLHQQLTGIESALGYDLYIGYHPKSTGTFQYGISMDLMPFLDDGLRDKIGQEKALEFIKSDPGRFPYLILRRLGYFWGLERRAFTYFYSNDFFGYIPKVPLVLISLILLGPFVIISISSVFGFLFGYKKIDHSVPIILFFIGYLIPHLLILGEDRFHFVLIPLLMIFATSFWMKGKSEYFENRKSTYERKLIIIGICICLLMIINWIGELSRDSQIINLLFGPNGNQLFLPY